MPVNSHLGKKMDLDIERLGINGEGVGQWDGCTIFVDGALPGEKVHASLYEKKKSYGRARVLEILSPSPDRQDPICPIFGQCGGCQIMHLRYEEQLKAKRQRVVDALERIGKFKDIHVEECVPSPKPLHYRNKIQIPVVPSDSGLRFGLYARNSHDLVDMKTCYIHCDRGEEVYQKIQVILKNSSLKGFDFKIKSGELRHLLIKTATATNEVLVVFVSAMAPTDELRRVAKQILEDIPLVKGVIHNFNAEADNTVLGKSYTTLAGSDCIEDSLCSLRFKVSPASFFQVNPDQAEQLYHAALKASGVSETDTVLDAYCGVGGMSLLFAKKAKHVIGVEYVPEAVEDAKYNAQINGIENVEFHAALVEDFAARCDSNLDVIVLNPPRKGCDPLVLDKLGKLPAKKIIYVSCDPATLARDLQLLSLQGWKIDSVQPFDMFPQTSHVETLVALSKA
ncbi:MAG: 23S rRNA (uracil(1939)-C(5))-methyltransferase RlmD [Chlamydiae bacterium]|nr:23S rRNA (uracil(1939)-C(5))-methyltransferase RlmD [Chlamydiota bacterium]